MGDIKPNSAVEPLVIGGEDGGREGQKDAMGNECQGILVTPYWNFSYWCWIAFKFCLVYPEEGDLD